MRILGLVVLINRSILPRIVDVVSRFYGYMGILLNEKIPCNGRHLWT